MEYVPGGTISDEIKRQEGSLDESVIRIYAQLGFPVKCRSFPPGFLKKLKIFLGKCLRRDSKERWTAKELLRHTFLDDLESNSPKVDEEFTRNSPTIVLDQASSNLPNWSWEEDWITVRSKEDIEETMMILEQDFNVEPNKRQLIDTKSYKFSAVNFEEFGSSIVINFEDLLPEAESFVQMKWED
ncbi:Mitogen-activated protein kinase kinase kinase 18 [Camellia lanceoleosa]|uniref:Mitogen-activated protein kinase kinase kinase 18 n=1 Tax=Camellia lanceoleosa TaxID=1840588 RepID=A0ACC0I4Z0_9ERIC|nr:Mitogen-activated protein kinase kinase kinase 18 [Camellia lanceoleosa]